MAKKKILEPIGLKEAQLFLDECAAKHEPVSVEALTITGEHLLLRGWTVTSGHWRGGTHNYKNPVSGQFRKLRDVLLFAVNGHAVII